MGLPLQAKDTTPKPTNPPAPAPAPAKTSKSSSQALAPATPAPAKDKTKTTVAKTSDKSSTPAAPAPSLHSTQNRQGAVALSSGSSRPSGSSASRNQTNAGGRLARLTAYWSGEGDYYTGRGMSSTGIHLHQGHCAVDPRIIPYGSIVQIDGLGKYLAVDTGSAVISREAARETGHNPEERNALVIDLYFESRRDGEHFAASGPKYAAISWTAPRSTASTQDVHGLVAE